jgi:hypothetical protein
MTTGRHSENSYSSDFILHINSVRLSYVIVSQQCYENVTTQTVYNENYTGS